MQSIRNKQRSDRRYTKFHFKYMIGKSPKPSWVKANKVVMLEYIMPFNILQYFFLAT